MKLQYCVVRHDTYELQKSVQGDGNNTLVIYELVDAVGKRKVCRVVFRGEWEAMAFENCIQELAREWKNRKETEIFEENSESPIEEMLYHELRAEFPGIIIQHHEFFDNGKLITKPDMYLPEHNICIYCDGREFHNTDERIQKDKRIDVWVQSQGMHSLRFTGSDIFNDVEGCVQKILNFIS